jgi:hypothetical protein
MDPVLQLSARPIFESPEPPEAMAFERPRIRDYRIDLTKSRAIPSSKKWEEPWDLRK